jgi:hypothetical protein
MTKKEELDELLFGYDTEDTKKQKKRARYDRIGFWKFIRKGSELLEKESPEFFNLIDTSIKI